MYYTWPLTSAKTWCPSGLDALINTSVFCADLRLEVGRKTLEGLSVASEVQWDMNHQNCYFNRTKVLMGVGTIGLLGI